MLAVGGLRDEAALRELTTGNLAQDGQRIDGAAPLAEIARRLTLACRSGIAVKIAGRHLGLARDPGRRTARRRDPGLRRPAGGPAAPPHPGRQAQGARRRDGSAERPLLERAWAQARIERLLHLRETAADSDDDLRKALGLEIVEVSVKNRVLSPFTSLLVLESEYDYQRFGLDRRALADILTVGPGGLEVLARGRSDRPRHGDRRRRPPSAERDPGLESPRLRRARTTAAPARRSRGHRRGRSRGAEEGVEGGVVGGVPGGVAGGVPAVWREALAAASWHSPASAPGPVAAPCRFRRHRRPPPPALRLAAARRGRGGDDRRRQAVSHGRRRRNEAKERRPRRTPGVSPR